MLYLGFGQSARHHAELVATNDRLVASTRDIDGKKAQSRDLPIKWIDTADHEAIAAAAIGERVLVSLPPDAPEQEIIAASISACKALIYLSSTTVYGSRRGAIDLDTPTQADNPQAEDRLRAEATWLAAGAVILRLPGLYDNQNNVVSRIASGKYRIPGDGTNHVSRIHLQDLAQIIDRTFALPAGQIWLVGDLHPASHLEIATYVCKNIGKQDLPDFVPLDEVHYTMRGDRQIDGRALIDKIGYDLLYPDFRAGLAQAIALETQS